jgi:hypothetical protein
VFEANSEHTQMDDAPEAPQAPKVEKVETVDLAAAVRRARLENAERAAAIADLREIEAGRLALLESALKPVVRQAPPGVDMFDLSLTQGEHPRLFIDMIAFVDMGHDRRTYRFFRDTLHGRVLIAESLQIDRIVAAVTDYIARRLVERERVLAADGACAQGREPIVGPARPSGSTRGNAQRARAPGASLTAEPLSAVLSSEPAQLDQSALSAEIAPPTPTGRLGFARGLGVALRFVIMTLGTITLIGFLSVAGYVAWTVWLQNIVARWMGAATL